MSKGQSPAASIRSFLGSKQDLVSTLFVVGLCFVMTFMWFRDGLFIAYAENELAFYRPNPAFLFAWIQNIGAGKDLLWNPPAIPTTLIHVMLRDYIDPVIREALMFFIILSVGALSMFYLARSNLSNKNRNLGAVVAACFYLVNPYVMIVVWKRFLFAHIFAYALFPSSLMFYDKGLRSGKALKYAILTSLSSVGFAFSFTIYGFFTSYWLLLLGWTLFRLVFSESSSEHKRLSVVKSLTVLIPVWFSLNAWWVVSIFGHWTQIQSLYTQNPYFSREGNLSTASISSIHTGGVVAVARLVYTGISGYAPHKLWGPLYQSPLFIIISFLPPIIAGVALLGSRRNRNAVVFSLLYIYGVFWANGTSPPTGGLFAFLFQHNDILQSLRGPYETSGLVVAIALSFLLGLGVTQLMHLDFNLHFSRRRVWRHVARYTRIMALSFVLSGILVLYPLPMWSGAVFTDVFGPTLNPTLRWRYSQVRVPPYYEEANKMINLSPGEFRIVHFPLSYTGGTQYEWSLPYMGGDPNDVLFDHPSIAMSGWYGGLVDNMINGLVPFMGSSNLLWKPLSLMNVRYIILHEDANATAMRSIPLSLMQGYLTEAPVPSMTFAAKPTLKDVQFGSWVSAWGNVSSYYSNTTQFLAEGHADEYGLFGIWLNLDEVDWSGFQGVSLMLRTSTPSSVIFQIVDSNGTTLAWYKRSSSSWEKIGVLLNSYDDIFPRYSRFEFSEVKRLLIGVAHQIPYDRTEIEINQLKLFSWNYEEGDPLSRGRWSPIWVNNASVGIDLNEFTGLAAVSVKGFSTPTAGFGLWYDFGQENNLSDYNFLSFQIKSNVTGPLHVELWDRNGNSFQWSGRVVSDFALSYANEWKNVTLVLRFPHYVTRSSINMSSLDHMLIALVGEYSPEDALELVVQSPYVQKGNVKPTEGIHFARRFDKLSIYEVDPEYTLPKIYTAHNLTLSDNFAEAFERMRGSFDPRKSVFFIKSQVNQTLIDALGATLRSDLKRIVTFEKINPTEFVAHVSNSTSPFFLVFLEEYNDLWEAYVDGQRLPSSDHFVVNGYANSWYLNQNGSFDVKIIYYGQTLLSYGGILSILSSVVWALPLIYEWFNLRRRDGKLESHYNNCLSD